MRSKDQSYVEPERWEQENLNFNLKSKFSQKMTFKKDLHFLVSSRLLCKQ